MEKKDGALKIKPAADLSSLTLPEIEKLFRESEQRRNELESENTELRAERDMAAMSLQKFVSLYENATMAYFTLGPDGMIFDLNRSAAETLGRERAELVNRKFTEFVSKEYRAEFDRFMKALLESHSKQTCEVKITVKDNFSLFVHVEGMVSEKEKKFIITALDITDRRLAEETVNNLLNEKEIILKEVHHRVKNNMYNIGALLNMQANAQDNPSAKNVLFDAAGRVQSMSVLYDKLYRSQYASSVSLKEYLPDLVHEIVSIFPNKGTVRIKTNVDDTLLEAKVLSMIGILTNELITNSMKYTFKDREDGILSVTASEKDRTIKIEISDNGPGLPESVSFQSTTGFGMQLVSMLTEQLGGNISIERGNGTKFVLEFSI